MVRGTVQTIMHASVYASKCFPLHVCVCGTAGLTQPQPRTIAKPQPIRPRIGALPASAALPSAALNGFQVDGHRSGSASPSTQDNEEDHRCVTSA